MLTLENFSPSNALLMNFVALSLGVMACVLLLIRTAAPRGDKNTWTLRAAAAIALWLGVHAVIVESGVLRHMMLPPPAGLFILCVAAFGFWLSRTRVASRMLHLPLFMLIGFQAFRVPLEFILHALYEADQLPVQMTWSGRNPDVWTGASAILLAALVYVKKAPTWVVRIWNIAGLALLFNVVGIAALSMPTLIRQFNNEPAVLLPLVSPWNWIVCVHVFAAFMGHLIVFRAMRR